MVEESAFSVLNLFSQTSIQKKKIKECTLDFQDGLLNLEQTRCYTGRNYNYFECYNYRSIYLQRETGFPNNYSLNFMLCLLELHIAVVFIALLVELTCYSSFLSD